MLLRFATTLALGLASRVAADPRDAVFDWTTIEPSADLQYHDCLDGLRCARLEVPVDWNNLEDNRTIAIAIATLPAPVPMDHPDHGGTIILNPGGPGNPGVELVRLSGHHLQKVIDNKKKYDYLGFDPRGIGNTTPRVDCYGGDMLARNTYDQVLRGLGSLDSSEDAVRRYLALSKGLGLLCENTLGDSNILEHVTTAAVSRDMVAMVDRLDDLRKKQIASSKRQNAENKYKARMTSKLEGDQLPRLQYLGLSYGTVLGNTFAAMFPERVGRIVLDGVVDVRDYMKNEWIGSLRDTEAVVEYFYDTCHASGELCALRIASDESGADIKRRVDQFIAELDASPRHHVTGTSTITVTGKDIRDSISASTYQPNLSFAPLAQILANALKGNFTSLIEAVGPSDSREVCGAENEVLSVEAAYAIWCSDSAGNETEHDTSYYSEIVKKYKERSETFGAKWAMIPLQCAGYRLKPKDEFHGPWVTPPADLSLQPGVPAAPLLFLTSRLDPVTPTANAKAMSAGHPGSAVVIQDSVGHCTIPSGWSDCTNKILRDYFEFGVVPQNGTFCTASCQPWVEDPDCHLDLNNTGAW